MASPHLSVPFARNQDSWDYLQLHHTLGELETWTNMLPSFGATEISQIMPYLKSKTEELANCMPAGTRIEQTRNLERLSLLRQGRLCEIK